MFDSLIGSVPAKSNIFAMITFLLIVLVIISSDTIISNISLNSDANIMHEIRHHDHHDHHLQPHKNLQLLHIKKQDLEYLSLFEESHVLDSEIPEFFSRNRCRTQLFMTWISAAESFGEREFFGLESLFKSNPRSCLIILSSSTLHGSKIDLQPLIKAGFRVREISPNLSSLFKNTPAERWLNEIKNGSRSPGEIPLPQNLSNLIRLAVLYKYGGVYLDTDFIILKDLSSLRNCIGAQSVDANGNWTRLNNAVLVFDKNHRLLHEFMEEFASNFDGNVWGYNGPYLVTRVVDRVARNGGLFNLTILPPMAFYQVGWNRIPSFFARPNDLAEQRWAKAKLRQLSLAAYGVHLWNRESSGLEIEEGSIIRSLLSQNCVLCRS